MILERIWMGQGRLLDKDQNSSCLFLPFFLAAPNGGIMPPHTL